ncbi:hypothetical protein GCM10007907_27890 [Chitinimonas prasina]|uniref:Phage tail protein n=1 Tax=Chitinimonas prasina TaxID=1434937 RepID=A0ABQ5YJ89_9NEIS|nr:hypothetical protein [Chitinimonas prasina]GLR13999.1 hypothetical protein GCM10007907_27890 [Chitinimonas prasina]
MANRFYDNAPDLLGGQKARAADVEAHFDAITLGFAKVQAELDNHVAVGATKAPLLSPALLGIPTAPTAAASAGGLQLANLDYVLNTLAHISALDRPIPVPVSVSGASTRNTLEQVDTTGGIITRTLPGAPALLAEVHFEDAAQNFHRNRLVVYPHAGARIENTAINEPINVRMRFARIGFRWSGSYWKVI